MYTAHCNMANRSGKKAMGTAAATVVATPGCEVCCAEGSQGKYKCPTCHLRYCSVACCRAHKETPCEKKDPRTAAGVGAGKKRGRGMAADDFFPIPSSIARRHHRDVAVAHAAQDQKEEEENWPVLTDDMRKALSESKWLRSALEDSTLCSLLTDIDGDAHQGEKLREALGHYPDLKGFVDRLLLEVGALKYENGQLVFAGDGGGGGWGP